MSRPCGTAAVAHFCEPMQTTVFAARHQLQILGAIVAAVLIAMMNMFVRRQLTTENLFHNESMFKDITVRCRAWMIRETEPCIAVPINRPAAFPIRVPASTALSISGSHLRARFIGVRAALHGVVEQTCSTYLCARLWGFRPSATAVYFEHFGVNFITPRLT